MNRLEQEVQLMVQAVMDHCASTGEDVHNRLREFKIQQRRQQAVLDDMCRGMGRAPDAGASHITRLAELEIDRQLLALERPTAEA